ncbi:MAG: ATP-dependent sacrificial sulfur transferase LarE [Candidatus Aminicenantes bacterium]|nr:ATP-dependent sacrificial sulfur transferase LarE [Candidatus Aminicenantes bacterium]
MSGSDKNTELDLKTETLAKLENLKNILKDMETVLVGFSGGVDSSLLLKTAQDVLGDRVLAVIAQSDTYPEKEQEEAVKLAVAWNVRLKIIQTDELDNPKFVQNPPTRCYFCKSELFSKLKEIASSEGILFVCDGSNYEDLDDFRPGAKAAEELGVRSPLKEAGLIKDEIREISRWMGLPTWNKPSLACLSSRFPYNTEIDRDSLKQISLAEDYLRSKGFTQVRVRHHGQIARIEVEPDEIVILMDPELRRDVVVNFKAFGYTYITLDLAGYRTGSMNEPLPDALKQ